MKWTLEILENYETILPVEDLQRRIWPGSETDIVPAHILHAAVHNGGLLIGAFTRPMTAEDQPSYTQEMIGFVFGFPGFYDTPDGPRLKHCSHMLGVDPRYRNQGLGFALKRAQWQMVRHQGIDRITWTYDPLLSLNAHLNIHRLGAVCNTYFRNFYGEMRDEINAGLPSDRFQVDWWVNSRRVVHRLSRKPRSALKLNQLTSAQISIINPASLDSSNHLHPGEIQFPVKRQPDSLVMVEIPSDFLTLKQTLPELALEWRMHIRTIFETLFEQGYLVTDFIYEPTHPSRSYYVLSYGESTF